MDYDHHNDGVIVADRKKEKQKVKPPRMYAAVLNNDDFTTMDFVVQILEEVFLKGTEEALQIMLDVHHNGKGIAGVYTKDVAETKAIIATQKAAENGFPLLVTVEPIE